MMLDTKEECLEYLKNNYTNPKSGMFIIQTTICHLIFLWIFLLEISFAGVSKIYQFFNGLIKKSEIEDFLSSIFSYTYHKVRYLYILIFSTHFKTILFYRKGKILR